MRCQRLLWRGLCWGIVLLAAGIGPPMSGGQKTRLLQKEPVFGPPKLVFQTSVLIEGGASEKGPGLREVSGLHLDSENRIYILERTRISIWTSSGEYLEDRGSLGQGPGEFIQPVGIFVHEDGRLFVNDQGRSLIEYSKQGDFIRRIGLRTGLTPQFYVAGQNIYGLANSISAEGVMRQFVKMDFHGNVKEVYDEFRLIDVSVKASADGRGGTMGGVQHEYSPASYLCFARDAIYYAYNLDYLVRKYSLAGQCLVEFGKQEKAQSAQSARAAAEKAWGKDYVQKHVVFPPSQPFFRGLLADEKGRVYVLRTRPFLSREKGLLADVFDRCGFYLYQLELPYAPALIKDGVLFGISHDEEGWPVIYRSVIRNYEELPASAPNCRLRPAQEDSPTPSSSAPYSRA